MRKIPDGCRWCGLSRVACDAAWQVEREGCCASCDSEKGAHDREDT